MRKEKLSERVGQAILLLSFIFERINWLLILNQSNAYVTISCKTKATRDWTDASFPCFSAIGYKFSRFCQRQVYMISRFLSVGLFISPRYSSVGLFVFPRFHLLVYLFPRFSSIGLFIFPRLPAITCFSTLICYFFVTALVDITPEVRIVFCFCVL